MKAILIGASTTILVATILSTIAADTASEGGKPDAHSLKYGLAIHFVPATFLNAGESWGPERFAPTSLDVPGWARAAKQAGMGVAVLTVKGQTGFCLWDSADYANDVGGSPVKVDIIAEFIAACIAEGVQPGVGYSIADSYNEDAPRMTGPVPPAYFAVIRKQIKELHSKYSGIQVQEFIGGENRLSPGQVSELRALIQQLNPACIIVSETPDNQGLAYDRVSVLSTWAWRPDASLRPAMQLYSKYAESMTMGRGLLLNVAPDRTGRIPMRQIAVLMEVKKLIAEGPAKSPTAAGTTEKGDAGARLKQLKELYGKGLINKDEYDRKAKEIIDSL